MFLRILLGIAGLIGVWLAWYFGARPLALLVGGLTTREVRAAAPTVLGWNGIYLVVDGRSIGIGNPEFQPAIGFSIDVRDRLVASANGRSMVLGPRRGTLPDDNETVPAFGVEPGDKLTFTHAQSRLEWPNFFEVNYMTGNTPIWKRFVYYRLVWTKPSGASLELEWRLENFYYASEDHFGDVNMTGDGGGLLRAVIVPSR